ncbi:MAG: glycosyl transferase, partial [Candidatus Omnitrophota bacterium]
MKGTDMDYGGFSKDGKEFIINRFDTPTPWINYLCNGKYAALISHTGGGYSFFEDPKYQRITRYRYNNVPLDRPGRYIYIRDDGNGEYWSAGWQPVCRAPDAWECRHGLGYTKISSENCGIRSEVTYFVPLDDNLEVWSVCVTNTGKRKRAITMTPYVEFALFDASEEFMFHPNLHYFSTAEYDSRDKAIYYSFYNRKKGYFKRNFSKVYFAVTNREVQGYDCEREAFIGKYRSETDPEVMKTGRHRNSKVIGGNAIGCLSVRFELEPGEEQRAIVVMGVDAYDNRLTPDRILRKYSDENHVARELERVGGYWEGYTSKLSVETPDPVINANINIWNQYQSRTTFDWSRYASLMYNTGTGRGVGFRDTSQDTMGVVHAIAPQVKDKIKLLAKNMYEDGHAYHLFYPTVGTGEPKKYSDDHLWMIPAVYSYICETGDHRILDEKAPYIEGSSGTIYEHMARALEYTLSNCGPHGFPRMFYADWNDCLNDIDRKGKGESVWVAMFLCYAAKQMAELAEETGKAKDAGNFMKVYNGMKDKINDIAWDGEWY